MVGQVTPIAIDSIGYRWYIVFVVSDSSKPFSLSKYVPNGHLPQVCNFTNALFFWAFLPETAKRPLEEMNYLFSNAPLFVPTMKRKEFELHDLENRANQVAEKQSAVHVEDNS